MSDVAKKTRAEKEYKERLDNQAKIGAGLFAGATPLLGLIDRDDYGFQKTNRALSLSEIGADSLDPYLRKRYLEQGPFALIDQFSRERVQELVPSGYTGFEPSDLSGAGTSTSAPGGDIRRQITVSPSAQPRRLSYEGLNADDLGPDGQKGYIWANPDQPQYGYAAGNYNRGGAQSSSNPAVNFLDVDMPESRAGRFATTGEVVANPGFRTDRTWGQRDYGQGRRSDGDVLFPKESIRGRSEVTAADVFTDARQRGFDLDAGDFSKDPGKAFKELVEGYAERRGMSPVQALESIATPVPALGTSDRFAGSLPIFQQFAIEQASPENLQKSGIGTVFTTDSAGTQRTNDGRLFLDDGDDWRPTRHFEVNPKLVKPQARAANFLRRQSGVGLMAGLDLAMDQSINKALQEGRTADAVLQGGLSVGGGAVAEALAKRGLSALANRGVTAPLQIASQAASPLAAIQIASMAERSTPAPDWSKEDRNNPYVARVISQEPSLVGQKGPDVPYWYGYPEEERNRILALPTKTRQVKAMPIGNQALYNLNNERRYAGQQLEKGNIPYLGVPINPLRWFK